MHLIAGHPAEIVSVDVADHPLRLYAVADLERLVDRGAVLRGEVEAPYWAYLWAGARALGAYVARFTNVRARRVLEIGCGLGLPGLAAAAGGADVVFIDTVPAALAFVRASLRLNALTAATVCADFRSLASGARFDTILAAEIIYDRPAFDAIAMFLARHLAPDGTALIADAYRTDTRRFYQALTAYELASHAIEVAPPEEGRPTPVRLTVVSRRPACR